MKTIIFGADGVTIDLNFAYFNFLTNHPNYRDLFKGLQFEDLDKALPLLPEYGALELKTHPTLGVELDKDFCNSPEFFNNRPLFSNVEETIKKLHQEGYNIIIISSTFDVEVKRKFLEERFASILDFINIECVEKNPQNMADNSFKATALRNIIAKYGSTPQEAVYVDTRIYDIDAGLEVGITTCRMEREFILPLPESYVTVPRFSNIEKFAEWVNK